MTVSPEDLDKFMEMDDDAQEAYLSQMHGDEPATGEEGEGGEGDQAESDAAAQPEAQTAEQGEAQDPENAEGGRQKMVPHGALHEARMKLEQSKQALAEEASRRQELEQRLAALEASRSQPQVPQAQQYQQQQAEVDAPPGLVFEDPAAIEAIVQQRLAPHMQTIEQLGSMLQQHQQAQQIAQLAAEMGDPDLPEKLQAFDAQVPQFVQMGIDPAARYFMAIGIESRDPARQQATQAATQAQARQMAVDAQAQRMAAAPQRPPSNPSLAGQPPAAANTPSADPSAISVDKYMAMDDAAEEALLRGDFG